MKEQETMVDIVSAETEKLNAAQRKLESSVDIEKEGRERMGEREENVLYDDQFALDMAKERAGAPAKPEAQPGKDGEAAPPEKSDKGDEKPENLEDGKPEGSADEGALEEGQEAPDKPAETEVQKQYAELRSKSTKVEQENAWLRDQLAQTRDTAAKVIDLSEKLKKVEPYLPLIGTMGDIDELTKNVQVPQDQMTGVNEQTGEKFATEDDKFRVLTGSKKGFAILVQKEAERSAIAVEKSKAEVQSQLMKIAAEMKATHNNGKPFDVAIIVKINAAMAANAEKINSPSVDYETKKTIVENAVLKAIGASKDGLTPEEFAEYEAAEALRADKAALLRSKSNLRPKKDLTPEQKKQVQVWGDMLKASQRGHMKLPD